MDYQIALSPDLGVSPEDFASTWNESPECRAVADARVEAGTQRSFEPLTAGELANLLITHRVPIVALNACQSGKQVGASERRPEEVRRVILRMLDAPGSQQD